MRSGLEKSHVQSYKGGDKSRVTKAVERVAKAAVNSPVCEKNLCASKSAAAKAVGEPILRNELGTVCAGCKNWVDDEMVVCQRSQRNLKVEWSSLLISFMPGIDCMHAERLSFGWSTSWC
jgi:hypothetical protein